MKVAVGQFAAQRSWRDNAEICSGLAAEADAHGADLLVLPEGVQARFARTDPPSVDEYLQGDQAVDGPFVAELVERSRGKNVTTVVGIKGSFEGTKRNTLAVVRDGELLCSYDKLHVMDAWGFRESDQVCAGTNEPVLFTCGGVRVGLMTCYDIRFPELARLLAVQGAQLLVVPAAWVAGPQKERHWELLVAARALENTCYVAASGECGPAMVGMSMFVDPMGIVQAQLGHTPGVVYGDVDLDYLADVRRQLPVLENRRFDVDPRIRAVPRDYETDPMPGIPELIERGRIRDGDAPAAPVDPSSISL
jgi:predicted amidohydrolase